MEARAATGRVLMDAKTSLEHVCSSTKTLAAAVNKLGFEAAEALAQVEVTWVPEAANEVSPAKAISVMKDVVRLLRDLATCTDVLCEIERRELGEPTEILSRNQQMTDEEAKEMIRAAKEVFMHLDLDQLEPPPAEESWS